MIKIIINFIILSIVPFISKVFKDKKILLNQSGDKHQKFASISNVPLIGGAFILISYILLFYNNNVYFSIFTIFIFLTGILSDTKKINSPYFRIGLQILVLIITIRFLNIEIYNTRVLFLDELLNNKMFNIIFVIFCILILINGTNFIDGLNGLALGYYISISFILIFFCNEKNIFFDFDNSKYFLATLAILLIYNFFNKLFLGDSGAYLLGLIYGLHLINYYTLNMHISPFFIIVLLWYPCFELLFSIIRKFNINKSPVNPDARHFHQLLFFYVRKKFFYDKLISNNLSSLLIIIYNFLIFYLASTNLSSSEYQIMIILISVLIYSILYTKLLKFRILYKK